MSRRRNSNNLNFRNPIGVIPVAGSRNPVIRSVVKKVPIKLFISKSLFDILDILKNRFDDVISKKLLDLNKFNNTLIIKYNWLSSTNFDDIISFALPDRIKNDDDPAAWKKENRQPVEIRKLLKKLLGRNYFSIYSVDTFIERYKRVHYEIQKNKESELEPNSKSQNNILGKIYELIRDKELVWQSYTKKVFGDRNSVTYKSSIKLTDNKRIDIKLYCVEVSLENFKYDLFIYYKSHDKIILCEEFKDSPFHTELEIIKDEIDEMTIYQL